MQKGSWPSRSAPDGKTVITASQDKTARLWDASTGRSIGKPLEASRPITAVAFHPSGEMVVTASRNRQSQLWNASDGTPIGPPMREVGEVLAVAFSPNGKTLLTGCFGERPRSGSGHQSTHRQRGNPIEGISEASHSAPMDEPISTGSEDKTARLWDAATHYPLGPL